MDALISGKAKLAALVTGDNASLINYNGTVIKEGVYSTIARQFMLYDDSLYIESTDRNKALSKLKYESDKSDALIMLLTVLDDTIKYEPKLELINIIDSLLERIEVLNYIRGILYARPLEDNSIKSIQNLNADQSSSALSFIDHLLASQNKINAIYKAWHEASQAFNTSVDDMNYIEGIFSRRQVIYQLCQDNIDKKVLGRIQFDCLIELKDIQNGRQILNKFLGFVEQEIVNVVSSVKPVMTRDSDTEHKGKRKRDVNIAEIYKHVSTQIEGIKKHLERGNKERAQGYTNALIQSQLERHDHSYAAMSLCQLSETAKNIGDYSLQLEWAKRATDISPLDCRAFGHLADAYLNLNRLGEAKESFKNAAKLGDYIFGMSGMARIERVRHNYDEALEILENAIQAHPDYTTLWLKAELYRETDQLDKALELYGQLKNEYQDKASAMCGYASVLTDLGQLAEAEKIYRDAVSLYPSDQVSSTGLGFLLARQGRFREAFKYLDQGIEKRAKDDLVPFLAKARALQIKGDFAAAIKLYKSVIELNQFVIDPWIELIEQYSNSSEFDIAREYLAKANSKFQNDSRLYFSEALILKNENKYIKALAILDQLKASHPKWVRVLTERANILKCIGSLKDSRSQFEEVLSINPYSKRAKVAIRLLNALEINQDASSDVVSENVIKDHMVAEDWDEMHIDGLLLLAKNRPQEAKVTLLKGYKSNPFKPLKEKFAVSLAVARNSLGQYATAKKTIRNINSKYALMQKVIIDGELGQLKEMENEVDKLKGVSSQNESVVLNLLEARYLRNHQENAIVKPDLSQIISEGVRAMLLAA